MEKDTLLQALQAQFGLLAERLENLPPGKMERPLAAGKWSPGQHAAHLMLSARPVTKALGLPKSVLEEKFGLRTDQTERDYPTLEADYRRVLATGVSAPPVFVPEPVTEAQRAGLVADVRQELKNLTDAVQPWSESELSAYQMRHPALCLLTVREMLMFTVLHTAHHLEQVRSD